VTAAADVVQLARALPAAVADLADPRQVGEDLERALAALLHRGRGHPADATCADCLAAGRVLAPAIGAMLLAARRKGRMPLTPNDYDAIGSALEELEQAARTRVAIKRRA